MTAHRLFISSFALASSVLFVGAVLRAQQTSPTASPATSPSALPTTQPATARQLDALIVDLAAHDPEVRAKARDTLMRLPTSELPRLRESAMRVSPLPREGWLSLRDVVVQLALIKQHEYKGTRSGMLGVSLSGWEQDPMTVGRGPVVVGFTMPGFDSFRALRAGDVVTSIGPVIDGVAGELRPVLDRTELTTFVQNTRPGDYARLEILRDGRPIQLTIRLAEKIAPGLTIDANQISSRYRVGQLLWDAEFSPVVKEAERATR